MNPYAAPGTRPSATVEVDAGAAEDDIAAAVPAPMARVAGAAVALAGGIVALTGAQTLLLVTVRGPFAVVPWVLLVAGMPQIVFGVWIFRARVWAAIAAIPSSGLLALVTAAWLVFSVGHGLISLFAVAAPFGAIAALVFAFLGMGPCQRATAARLRLRAQGMNLGI